MSMKRIGRIAVGLALLGALVMGIGPLVVWEQLVALRWVIPVLVVAGLVKHAFRTVAWQLALDADDVRIPISQLFQVRIAAHGVAYASGLDLIVSEPLKPWLLRKVAPADATIPATLVEASLYWLVSLAVTTVGAFAAVTVVADTRSAQAGAWGALAVLGGVLWLVLGRTRQVPRLARIATRWTATRPRWSAILDRAAEAEVRMRSFRLRHPGTVGLMLGLNLFVQVVMLGEVATVLAALGHPHDLTRLFEIEAASRVVKMLSFYVPARMGADEAGAAGAFLLLGLNPAAGVALALARRLQVLAWATLGLAWFAAARRGGAIADLVPVLPIRS